MRKFRRNSKRFFNFLVISAITAVLFIAFYISRGVYDEKRRQAELKRYPVEFSRYAELYSDKYGIDKYLIYAVIKTESDFDHAAVSEAGARGLMQIMPDTFDWIKFRLGEEEDECEYLDMYSPEENIKYGSYFLHYLEEKFTQYNGGQFSDDEIELIAAGYYSGIGNVSEWLKNPEYSDSGVWLDEIPRDDTRHYVNKVTDAYRKYIQLYQSEK